MPQLPPLLLIRFCKSMPPPHATTEAQAAWKFRANVDNADEAWRDGAADEGDAVIDVDVDNAELDVDAMRMSIPTNTYIMTQIA